MTSWAVALATVVVAHAWEASGTSWADESFPIPYQVADSLGTLDDAEALAAIQAAFQAWEDVGCTEVAFVYEGRALGATWGAQDGRNVVFLLDDAWPGTEDEVSESRLFLEGTTVVEADVALNGWDYAWSLDDQGGSARFDVQAAVVHELGHALGLAHSADAASVMNPSTVGQVQKRLPGPDDEAGICSLYADLVPPQPPEVGDFCETDGDCEPDLFCIDDGLLVYCTRTCDGPDDCPVGYTCLPLSNGNQACASEPEDPGCGCSGVGGKAGGLLALVAGLVARRRPRRSTG